MSYVPAGRVVCDADSHIMELPDFLQKYADPNLRDQMPPISYAASSVTDEEVAEIVARGGRHSAEQRAEMIAMGETLIANAKEIQALGAFDGADRRQAMDQLGFRRQLVFATYGPGLAFAPSERITTERRYGAARAHNRHMSEFCSHDSRLLGVAAIPLDDVDGAVAELDRITGDPHLKAVWVPHRPLLGSRSPGHLELDAFWGRLCDAGLPFVIHVGGAPLQMSKPYEDNGRPPTKDWLGGGENVRTRDAALLHQSPEAFLSMMVLDGVLERFPALRGAAVELGAGWVPAMSTRLDWVVQTWGRSDTNVNTFKRLPSQQIAEQLAFTPFVLEDIGAIIAQSDPALYLFSSDYPHAEGGKDPLGKFDASLADFDQGVRDLFFAENFLRIFPNER